MILINSTPSNLEEKIKYLVRYNAAVEAVDISTMDNISKDIIPAEWLNVLTIADHDKKIQAIMSLWKRYCGSALRNTISYLTSNCKEVDLIRIDGRLTLIYSVKGKSGKILYYEGRFSEPENCKAPDAELS